MSGFGVHAGLALAGVIAGLPVAAVVQWRREPPRVLWRPIVSGPSSSPSAAGVSPGDRPRLRWFAGGRPASPYPSALCYYSAPGGSLVTSVCCEDDHPDPPHPGAVQLIPVPWPLVCFSLGGFDDLCEAPGGLVTERGVTWRRCEVFRNH